MTDRDRIASALGLLQRLWPRHDGPGHVVYADCNLDDGSLDWCIGLIDKGETECSREPFNDPTHPVYPATRALLVYLREIPLEARERFAASDDFYTLDEWEEW